MSWDEKTNEEIKAELYRKYYEASKNNNEWSDLNESEIRKEIERINEAESWNSGGA